MMMISSWWQKFATRFLQANAHWARNGWKSRQIYNYLGLPTSTQFLLEFKTQCVHWLLEVISQMAFSWGISKLSSVPKMRFFSSNQTLGNWCRYFFVVRTTATGFRVKSAIYDAHLAEACFLCPHFLDAPMILEVCRSRGCSKIN